MATLNNNVFLTIPYTQNTLTYNVPLITYTESQIADFIENNDIKIQPFKQNALLLDVNIGIELRRNVDFSSEINNTADGIIITLHNNILGATHLKIRRESDRVITTDYVSSQQQSSLKQQLQNDTKNVMNALQDDHNRINDLNANISNYANSIVNNYDAIKTVEQNLLEHKHRASQVIFDPIPTNDATNVQEALENVDLKILEVQSGIVPRESVRVASNVNVDILTETIIDGVSLNLNDRVLLRSQANLTQNGVYVFNGTVLNRSNDLNTLLKIQGSKVQVDEGTFEKRAFYFVANNFQGIIELEPIIVEEVFSPIGENQVLLSNLNELPPETIIGNIQQIDATPTALTKQEIREFIENENTDNTSDLDKPISTATQTALDLKASQSDLNDLNSYVVATDQALLMAIGEKQNILPVGGENDYVGFSGNEVVIKTFSKGTVGLENANNTSDLNKPISLAQEEEFNQCQKQRGAFNLSGLNLAINLLDGNYVIPDASEVSDLPAEVLPDSSIILYITRGYIGSQYNILTQVVFEKTQSGVCYFYTRAYNVINQSFSLWGRLATKAETDALNIKIDNAIIGSFTDTIYTSSQVDTLLSTKQDEIPLTDASDYYRGDGTFSPLISDNVVEGQANLYFNEARARGTLMQGLDLTHGTPAVSTDTILQAIGKLQRQANEVLNNINLKLDGLLVGEVKSIARQNFNDFTTDGGTGTWLYCDGRALSTATYPKLFAILGYAYGGSGSSFNIPDIQGRVIAGTSGSEPINKKEGNKTHTLAQSELPNYNLIYNIGTYNGSPASAGNEMSFNKFKGNASAFIPSGGGNQPHNNMQPTIYLPYFIYAL